MSSYLAYSYSCNLTTEERDEIDLRTKKCRQEFSRGFSRGISLSLAAISVYSLATKAASAIEPIKTPDSVVPEATPGQVCPAPNAPNQVATPTEVAPTQPGFRPLSDTSKGAYVGGVTTVCAAAAQSRDFYIGLACAALLAIGGIVLNRPNPNR